MHLNQRKAEFSIAYVHAIAAAAGFICEVIRVDLNSIDVHLLSAEGAEDRAYPSLDVQLKCTTRPQPLAPIIRFPLKRKNYDDLRKTKRLIPRILVLLEVPDVAVDWVQHNEHETVLRHCAFWCSISGLPETRNTSNVAVDIPRAQQFTVGELQAMMKRIEAGGTP
jgi:hypothetical protein